VKTYTTCNLVEEYIGAKIFPVRAGWSVVAWNDFSSAIKIPKFAQSFGLTKIGTHLPFFVASYCSWLTIVVHIFLFYLTDTCLYFFCSYQHC
jgi:hypothetical protein